MMTSNLSISNFAKALALGVTLIFPLTAAADDPSFNESLAAYQQAIKEKDFHKASYLLDGVIQLSSKEFGGKSKNTIALLQDKGALLLKAFQYKEARETFLELIPLVEEAYGESSLELVQLLLDIGDTFRWHDSKSPKKYLERAETIAESKFGKDSIEIAKVYEEIGRIFNEGGKYAAGDKRFNWARKIYTDTYGESTSQVGALDFKAGVIAYRRGQFERAETYLKSALRTYGNISEGSNDVELRVHSLLVPTLEELGKSEEATQHCVAIGKMTPQEENQERQPLFKPSAEFPDVALSRRDSGWVIVEYDVNQYGFVENPKIIDSKGSSVFHKPSMEAAKRFRYAPKFVDGVAVVDKGVRNRFTFDYK